MSSGNEHETNEQFIARIMNFGCPTGPLIQAFVIQSLRKYAEAVSDAPAESLSSPMLAFFALPAFAMACLLGLVDGLVKRDLRKWAGGRESSFVYHHSKHYTAWFLTAGFAMYLSWPIGGLNPAWMVLIFAALVAMSLSVTVASFKKYL